MIAARLLDAYGVLGRHLDCDACERDAKRKRYLGCGVQPGGGWRAEQWRRDNPKAEAGKAPYRFANLGEVDSFGFLWPCCPRFFAAFASDNSTEEALDVLDLRWWLEEGALSSVAEGTLAAGTADLLRFSVVFGRHCRDLKDKREAEKRRVELERANKRRR